MQESAASGDLQLSSDTKMVEIGADTLIIWSSDSTLDQIIKVSCPSSECMYIQLKKHMKLDQEITTIAVIK